MSLEFEHLIGLNAIPSGVVFHPNGQKYIYSSGANVIIGDLTDSHSQSFFRFHDDFVTSLCVSPSGNLVASGQRGSHSNIYVWNFASQEVLYCFEEHDHLVQNLAFSHDEKLLVSIGNQEDGKLIVWDMSSGFIVASSGKLPPGTACIAHGGFVKDIKRRDTQNYLFVTAGADGFMFWNLDPYRGEFENSKLVGDARTSVLRNVRSVCFSDDRELVYGSTTSGDYVIVNVKHQRVLQAVLATKTGVDCILASDQGIIIGCGDNTIKFFSTSNTLVGATQLDGRVIGLSFSPDRLEVLAATSMGTIARVSIASKQHIIISESHTAPIVAIAYADNNNDRFATASLDGTLRVWDAAEYVVNAIATARRGQEMGATPACLVLADVLFSGWSDGKIQAHSAETGASLWFIDNAHPNGVTALVLSHNKRFILSGGPGGEVRLWELRSRDLISHLKEHVASVTCLALFKDDTMGITGSRDRCILRWDLTSERRMFCHSQRMGGINSLVISNDQSTIVSVGQEKKITYWRIDNQEPIFSQYLDGEQDEGRCIAMSHDGSMLATGGTAGKVRLWDYATKQELSSAVSHSARINSIAFSPDDKQIVSAGDDGSIVVWYIF